MNKQENYNQTIIEDLPVDDAQRNEIKGGDGWPQKSVIATIPGTTR